MIDAFFPQQFLLPGIGGGPPPSGWAHEARYDPQSHHEADANPGATGCDGVKTLFITLGNGQPGDDSGGVIFFGLFLAWC